MGLNESSESSRALVVQLARLGDVVQSLPAITALHDRRNGAGVDVLCAAPLTPVASLFPPVRRVLAWEGVQWREWALAWPDSSERSRQSAQDALRGLAGGAYEVAYNLNQHRRSILAAHLLAGGVVGPGEEGPLSTALPSWAAYLRQVVETRGENRVHLADAFCGLCGVRPPGAPPKMCAPSCNLPDDLSAIGREDGLWTVVVVGAGDPVRCVPPRVWTRWIAQFLAAVSHGRVVLAGSAQERDRAAAIQDGLSALVLGRVWDTTGRLDLTQLVGLMSRCHWIVGADTGPLHVGAALGLRAMGFYVARARVHETGPYGSGHWVWQADAFEMPEPEWPVGASIDLLLTGCGVVRQDGWALWESRFDGWGTYYGQPGGSMAPECERERVWRALMPSLGMSGV